MREKLAGAAAAAADTGRRCSTGARELGRHVTSQVKDAGRAGYTSKAPPLKQSPLKVEVVHGGGGCRTGLGATSAGGSAGCNGCSASAHGACQPQNGAAMAARPGAGYAAPFEMQAKALLSGEKGARDARPRRHIES